MTDGLEQYTEPDSSDRPGDAIESGMRETVAHPGIDGTWHHYGNIEWWEPDQLYDSDYARPICPVKHCASGRDHECRTICTRINPDEELKPEFVETENPVSGGWYCTHHGWFRIHNYPRATESESEQATLLADGGRVRDTEEVTQLKLDLTQLLGAAAANSTLHACAGGAIHVQIGTIGVSTFVEISASGHIQTKTRPEYQSMPTEQQSGELSRSETAAVVVELRDYEEMSFSEIAQCVPRSREWVEERYDEHGGFNGA